MSRRSDRFNRSFGPLGNAPCSDGNHAVELLVDALDSDWSDCRRKDRMRTRDYELKLDIFIAILSLCGLGHLVPTLKLIVRHGKFCDESIAEMTRGKRGKKARESAKKRYRRHRLELLNLV